MENKEIITKWVSWILVIVGLIFFLRWAGIGDWFRYMANRVCIQSHEEQYVEQPLSIVVGGGEYGGGIGIPLGDGKIKTRTVCDNYELPTP